MKALYVYHLAASVAHGIEQVDPLDTIDGDLLSFRDFCHSLPTLTAEDGFIYTAVDPDQLEELKENYSIKTL